MILSDRTRYRVDPVGRIDNLLSDSILSHCRQFSDCRPYGSLAKALRFAKERKEETADYYWSVYQSEWASDVVFHKAGDLRRRVPHLAAACHPPLSECRHIEVFGQESNTERGGAG
jgi:hypothetical protein